MPSAICFNLDQSKILSSSNGLIEYVNPLQRYCSQQFFDNSLCFMGFTRFRSRPRGDIEKSSEVRVRIEPMTHLDK